MWEQLVIIFVLAVFLTLLFIYIPNKSNFPKKYIIPIMVSLIIKYSLGDLDKGYNYTISDICYWFMILFIPYAIVQYLER